LSKSANLQDTCGVISLHGIPGVVGGISTAIALGTIGERSFSDQYVARPRMGDSSGGQATAVFITIGIALLTGIIAGAIASLNIW
jgi:ammonia channel protein AmtB